MQRQLGKYKVMLTKKTKKVEIKQVVYLLYLYFFVVGNIVLVFSDYFFSRVARTVAR